MTYKKYPMLPARLIDCPECDFQEEVALKTHDTFTQISSHMTLKHHIKTEHHND